MKRRIVFEFLIEIPRENSLPSAPNHHRVQQHGALSGHWGYYGGNGLQLQASDQYGWLVMPPPQVT